MATTLVLVVALATAPQPSSARREPIAPETAAHVQRILAGSGDERCAAARALAALSEADAVGAVRVLLATPVMMASRGGGIGSCSSTCWWDAMIGLPVAESYVARWGWLDEAPVSGSSYVRGLEGIDDRTDPRTIGCWLIEGWDAGPALLPDLCKLLASTVPDRVRVQAVRALGARGDPTVAGRLGALLCDTAVGAQAVGALARLGPAADAHVVAALRTQDARAEVNALWFLARHAARIPADVLSEIVERLDGEHHREALTVLMQAGMRAEGLLLRQLARGDIVAERAVAGLILLPGRTGPAFPALLVMARDASAPRKTRALALRYVAESPAGVALLTELVRLAETPGDLMVRTAAARALGRLPAAKPTARDAALAIVASDAPDKVRIAALRSAVDCDSSAAMRARLESLSREGETRWAVRTEASSLIAFTAWRD